MNKNRTPRMYDRTASFGGITLEVDPIDRSRTDRDDNVMAMFYEEQPFMWEFVRERIQRTLNDTAGDIDFLDVGTGSGVWAILVSKNLDAENVLAIDKSMRAVNWAMDNAERNGVDISVRQEFYNISTAPYKSCKVIGIYAPYHLYPADVESEVPLHARGGIDGQQVFKEQLTTANYHLADDGIIVFNQMCLGRDGKPEFVEYIPKIMGGCSLEYTNIFPSIDTREFLLGVYGDEFREYVEGISQRYPELFYCDGIITRDGKDSVENVEHDISLRGRTWNDRINLHHQISRHSQEMKGGITINE